MSNSIEVPSQSLIPALNLPETKQYTLNSLSNDGVFDPRLLDQKQQPVSTEVAVKAAT